MKPSFSAFPFLAAIVLILAGAVLHVERDAGAQQGIDISGDWEIALSSGQITGSCGLGVVQREGNVLFAGGCTLITPLLLDGEIDETSGAFSVSDFGISATGQADRDGGTILGTWNALGLSGTFGGTRVDRTPHFIDITGTWQLTLHPPGGAGVGGEPFDVCSVDIRQIAVYVTATLDCQQSGESPLAGGFDPSGGRFFLLDGSDNVFSQLDGVATTSSSVEGTYFAGDLYGSFDGTRTSGPLGSVNCDETIDSIDAAVILQVAAGLLTDAACSDLGDVISDGDLDSLDAVLVLQHAAGLIVSLSLGR